MSNIVLITGATGFIGSHLAIELLQDPGTTLIALSRDKRRTTAAQRVRAALSTALEHAGIARTPEWDARIDSVRVIEADLADGSLPARLADVKVETVWHCAGKISFDWAQEAMLEEANARGTQALVDWAGQAGCAAFNFVSTAYVSPGGGPTQETLFGLDAEVHNPYETSKRRAEEAVAMGWETARMPFRIFRPSIVVRHARTTMGATNTGLYGFLILAERLKREIDSRIPGYFAKYPVRLLTSATADINIIPVDAAVRQMRDLAAQDRTRCQIFNIVGEDNVTIDQLAAQTQTALGIRFMSTQDESTLGPVDVLVNREVALFAPYLKTSYRFGNAHVKQALRDPSALAQVDDALIGRLVDGYFAHQDNPVLLRAGRQKNWMDDFEERQIQRGDQTLKYYIGGQGDKTLLIVNAYGQSLYFWSRLAALLMPDHRVVMWEMRGTSCTAGGMTQAAAVGEHVDDALAIVRDAGIQSCEVMGWCTGPKLIIEMHQRAPGLLRGAVFVTPAFKGLPGLDAHDTRYERHMEPLCRKAVAQPRIVSTVRQALSAILAGKQQSNDADVHKQVETVLSLMSDELRPLVVAPFVNDESLLAYAHQLVDFWGHDVSGLLPGTTLPVLVLTGERDEIAAASRGLAVAERLPRHVACNFVNGGHYIHFENAAEVAELYRAFSDKRDIADAPMGVQVVGRSRP